MSKGTSEKGFTYIDVMIAVVILLVGILALTAAVTNAFITSTHREQQLIAKQIAGSTLESIFSVRDIKIKKFGWNAIGIAGEEGLDSRNPRAATGIFQPYTDDTPTLFSADGEEPSNGQDGIAGTRDDKCGDNGADTNGNCLGTELPGMMNFKRRIIITDICDVDLPSDGCTPSGNNPIMLRRIQVIVFYRAGLLWQQESESTIIANLANE